VSASRRISDLQRESASSICQVHHTPRARARKKMLGGGFDVSAYVLKMSIF
jgi:hypothetical protein